MAGIQGNGISGLDINGLVSQLVAAEGAPISQRITRHEVQVTTKLSALGTFKGAMSAFKSALEPLKTVEAFQSRKATSGNTDYFTVSAATNAVAGHYDVEVVSLAKAHQLASQAYEDGSASQVGYGTLTITVGEDDFAVDITAEDATLADIRDSINAAPDNKGVKATILNGAEGARLVLTSSATGTAKAIEVAASGGDGGLNDLVYDADGTQTLSQVQEARNAQIKIASFEIESSTNVFTDAIDGVTITVKKQSQPDETFGLDVAVDNATVQSRISKFVSEYNSMQAQFAKLGKYDAATSTAGPLLGDALLRGVESEMRRGISNPVTGVAGEYSTLASIGIKTTVSGALEVDNDKLTKALAADPEGVAKLFGSEDGIAARLFTQLEQRLASNGDVETRTKRLNDDIKSIAKDKEAYLFRIEQLEARYRKQFSALDSLLSQMQSTSSYLAQQLGNLPKIGG
jgi:flagellar hook-associated protein 2